MNVPKDRKYTREHEWVKLRPDGTALVGITEFAQSQLGDIVYLDLPKPGMSLKQFDKFGEIESVKSVSDLFIPVSGEVVESNERAVQEPEVVNHSPNEEGWLLKIKVKDASELANLLSAEDYDRISK